MIGSLPPPLNAYYYHHNHQSSLSMKGLGMESNVGAGVGQQFYLKSKPFAASIKTKNDSHQNDNQQHLTASKTGQYYYGYIVGQNKKTKTFRSRISNDFIFFFFGFFSRSPPQPHMPPIHLPLVLNLQQAISPIEHQVNIEVMHPLVPETMRNCYERNQ